MPAPVSVLPPKILGHRWSGRHGQTRFALLKNVCEKGQAGARWLRKADGNDDVRLDHIPVLAIAGQRLLDRVQARRLVVSFPNHSLGGRSKGMARTYDQRFQQLVAGRPWQVRRFEFSSEIAYLVDTQSSDCP